MGLCVFAMRGKSEQKSGKKRRTTNGDESGVKLVSGTIMSDDKAVLETQVRERERETKRRSEVDELFFRRLYDKRSSVEIEKQESREGVAPDHLASESTLGAPVRD